MHVKSHETNVGEPQTRIFGLGRRGGWNVYLGNKNLETGTWKQELGSKNLHKRTTKPQGAKHAVVLSARQNEPGLNGKH